MRTLITTIFTVSMLTSGLALAEMPERPLPPAPAEKMGPPVDCKPTTQSTDPNAAVNKDCPMQPETYDSQTPRRTQQEKNRMKNQNHDPESSGRNSVE